MDILIGCDYGGTYSMGTVPSDTDYAAVAKFRREGGIFGIVTRRGILEAIGIEIQYRGEYDFVVCSTGAACFFSPADFLWRELIDTVTLERLYRLCDRCGAIHTYIDAVGYRGEMASVGFSGEVGCTVLYYDGNFKSARIGGDMMKCVEGLTQFTVEFPSEKLARAAMGRIADEFGDGLVCHGNGRGFDVTPRGVDKASGLRRIADHYGISYENVWAVGDGENDVTMLNSFNGIAMKGSLAASVGKAKYEAASVAEAIEIIG